MNLVAAFDQQYRGSSPLKRFSVNKEEPRTPCCYPEFSNYRSSAKTPG